MLLREADDLDGVVGGFIGGAALVRHAEAVAGGDDGAKFMHLRFERAEGAALVEHEADIGDVPGVALRQGGAHRLGVGHLRHAAGMDEAGDLDATHAAAQRTRD